MSHFRGSGATGHFLTARDVLRPSGSGGRVDEEISSLMGALSSPTRIRVLFALLAARDDGTDAAEMSSGEIAKAIGMSDSATSHQLRVLRQLGLVSRRREGRMAFYDLADHHLRVLLTEALYHVDHERLRVGNEGPGTEQDGDGTGREGGLT